MKKLTYAILLALGSAHVNATTISGKVTDQTGKPVTEGVVSLDGSLISAPILSDGSFSLTGLRPGKIQLHIASPNHIHEHSEYQLTTSGIKDVTVVVRDASIEVLDVTAVGLHASTIEGTLPVSVLAGDELNRSQDATLGDTLDDVVGVHSSAHGGVVSTPIIRGLSGPRVLIAQNGLDVSDVSRVGPDHMVVSEASNAEQIEVLRGPATLFYGSGAIGGVVNIVNQTIPTYAQKTGEVAVSRNSNNGEEAINANVITDVDNFVFSASGFYREADEYRIPGMAELEEHGHDEHDDDHDDHDDDHEHDEEHEGSNRVENSDYRVSGISVGGSYLFDNGFIGASIEKQDAFYGIPGHAHGEEEHGHDEHEDDDHDDDGDDQDEEHGEEEEVVNLDMEMTRYQFMGRFSPQTGFINEYNFSGAFTEYEHIEFENGEPGTEFANETTEFRIEAMHQAWNDWNGGLSFHFKRSDLEAVGEEAFTPPTETTMFGLAVFEEKEFGDFLVQLGARVERVELDVPMLFENDVELIEDDDDHDHDDDHDDEHDDEHDHDHNDMPDSINETFTAMSISAGTVWNFAEGYNAALSLSRSERVPAAAELFSLGPHLGSGFFEIGALYDIDDENHVVISSIDFDEEISNNLDFSLRKFSGNLGVVLNLFYNDVENYYFDANTGLFSEFSHEHGEEEHGHDDDHDDHEDDHDDHDDDHDDEHGHEEEGHSDELLPVILFTSTDAKVYGAELQVNYKATENITLRTQADLVRNRIDTPNGTTEAPRTSPTRWTVGAEYANDNWYADVKIKHVFEQDKIAQFEDATDSYTLVDFNLSYYMTVENTDVEFFLKGRNITDAEARVHTSYLRNDAPLPGRSVVLGVRASF